MISPLVRRLVEVWKYPAADTGNLPQLLADNEHLVLFFPGDPERYPEGDDVAVILPELVRAFEGRLNAAVVHSENETALRQRYPFKAWPGLVFLRRGVQLGSICKVKDWADYLEQIEALLGRETGAEQAIPSVNL
ncbi:hypothetical protein FKG94_15260 [Exilibacterium tricleocarpae]|uniref:Hydrogenase expression/formation protein n=1 Tax=Exilibacterium tricleocarpae TaxID=2591008 RepID=A0A545TFI6_9GAMM|nr:hypothetical protein [Exilibacterium tricleocarpae]TQV75968.1 hypothetical protein FKG94_15260 [Exilibacterium tricleocarpae]